MWREREPERVRKLTKCQKVTVGPSLCFTGNIDVGELSKHAGRHYHKYKMKRIKKGDRLLFYIRERDPSEVHFGLNSFVEV